MKRREFIRYLENYNCELFREGGKHSVFINRNTGKVTTVPRHQEIFDQLARKICKDLEIPVIK